MHSTARPYIAAYLLLRRDDKVAFVLRSNTSYMDNHYSLPAGKIENDESYSAGAIREAFEEVGVKIEANNLKLVHVMHRREETDCVDMFFETNNYTGEPHNAEPHVHSELVWLDTGSLPNNTIPYIKFAIEQIEKGNLYSERGWA